MRLKELITKEVFDLLVSKEIIFNKYDEPLDEFDMVQIIFNFEDKYGVGKESDKCQFPSDELYKAYRSLLDGAMEIID